MNFSYTTSKRCMKYELPVSPLLKTKNELSSLTRSLKYGQFFVRFFNYYTLIILNVLSICGKEERWQTTMFETQTIISCNHICIDINCMAVLISSAVIRNYKVAKVFVILRECLSPIATLEAVFSILLRLNSTTLSAVKTYTYL